MNIEVILIGLLIVSTLTGLTTEAIKKLLDEAGKSYRSNMLAGCVSLVLSLAIGIGYVMVTDMSWGSPVIVCLVALVFLSWLCSMVGYDKVIQTISQIRKDD